MSGDGSLHRPGHLGDVVVRIVSLLRQVHGTAASQSDADATELITPASGAVDVLEHDFDVPNTPGVTPQGRLESASCVLSDGVRWVGN
jgi:hypothetical protein